MPRRRKKDHPNWGGRREGSGRKPNDENAPKKATKCFWVTPEEAEALTTYLDELRNGKPVEEK